MFINTSSFFLDPVFFRFTKFIFRVIIFIDNSYRASIFSTASKTKKRQAFAEECVFSAQEFEASGIRELSFEELLEVNGGRQVKDDPRTDRNSDVCRSSGRSSRGNSSGSSSRGSSSSGGSSSRGGSSGSYGSSSSSKGASGGRSSSPSKGSSSSGSSGRGSSAHDRSSERNTGSSKGSVSSGSASGSSSKNSQSSSFGETKPSNPSKPDRKEERSSTVGGGSSGNTSFGRNTGSSGGGGSFDRSSPSRDRDSSDRDSSRSDRYSSGSSVSSGSTVYTPPVQSQPVPAPAAEKTTAPVQSQVQSEQNKNTSVSAPQNSAEPNRGKKSSPTQDGGASQGEAAALVRNQGKNAGAINSGTKGGVLSGFKEFWGNAGNGIKNTTGKIWDKFGNVNKTNAESYVEKSRGGSWQSKENFPVPTAQGSKPSSEGYVPPVEQNKKSYYKVEERGILFSSVDSVDIENKQISSLFFPYNDRGEIDYFGKRNYTFPIDNKVANELNGLRQAPNVKTSPVNKSEEPEYYFPRNFPTGVTVDLEPSIRVPKDHKNYSDLGDVFIPTTAVQKVPTYGTTTPVPDENGIYTSTGTQLDGGYGLHFSKGGRTLGCLSFFSQESAENFAALSDSVLLNNGSSKLRVY